MSDVTGPISTLPGTRHSVPKGTMCDFHSDRLAITRLQGETDSFGCEMHDLCAQCAESFRKAANSPEARTGQCDWCKQPATDLRPRRDIDEGMAGRVYDVCGACVRKDSEAIEAELRENEAEYDYADDWADDDWGEER